jgi:AraC-like DNA-binding protein
VSDNSLYNALRLNYLYIEEYKFAKSWTYPATNTPYSMIRFINQGSGRFIIDDVEFLVEENDIVYIPQESNLFCESNSDKFSFISIRFTSSIPLNNMELWSEIIGIQTKIPCTNPEVKMYFTNMLRASKSNVKEKSMLLRGHLELVMAYIIKMSDEVTDDLKLTRKRTFNMKHKGMNPLSDQQMDQRIQTIIEYLLLHPESEMSIQDMCEMVDISSASLRRLFKQHTGKSPSDFMVEVKMTYAARRLLGSNEQVSIISYQLGYKDPNYFTRTFKKYFGAAPHNYRKQARN